MSVENTPLPPAPITVDITIKTPDGLFERFAPAWINWFNLLRTMVSTLLDNPTFVGAAGLPSYVVAGLPLAAPAGRLIYVSDEAGGAVPAFSDGTNWRRVTDRAIVS